MKSAMHYPLDADTAFRVPGSAALTANGANNSSSVSLDKLSGVEGTERNKLAKDTYTMVVNIESVSVPYEFGSIALSGALTTGDAFTVDNGVDAPTQFVADTDFTLVGTAAGDAGALAQAINDAAIDGIVAYVSTATVYVENFLGTAGALTEDTDVGTVATVTDFATSDKSYTFTLQLDDSAFGSPVTVWTYVVTGAEILYIPFDSASLAAQESNHEALRLVMTIAEGTAGNASIAYGAWLL